MVKTALSACLLAAFAGCSSLPTAEGEAAPVPPDRVYVARFVGPAEGAGEGTIVFLRDWGFGGMGCTHDVFIDSVKVFGIKDYERIAVHLAAGDHFIRIENNTALCPSITTSQSTVLKAGTKQVFRVQLTGNGGLNLTRME
jgi:hypothetical protein